MATGYTPTYDDWYKQWDASPWKNEWSQADLELAKLHPEFGMTGLSYKNDWHNATTDEQRAKANQGMEDARKYWGNYTGGADGSQYYAEPLQHIQADETQDAISAWNQDNEYKQAIRQTLGDMGAYGDFSYGRETDYQRALDRVINPEAFAYDYQTDPVYSAYAKQYTREGRRASEDTLGQYAAMTGGRPSTAAVTASQQAGNYYGAALADKIPELYNQRYQQYLQEYSQRLQGLNAIQADRATRYGEYTDRYNRMGDYLTRLQGQEKTDYGRLVDQYDMERQEEATERARAIEAADREIAAEQRQYERDWNEDQRQYERAQAASDTEWSRMLDQWKMQNTDRANEMDTADWMAQHGRYDELAKLLGMSVDEVRARYETPETPVYYGSGSGESTGKYDPYEIASMLQSAGVTDRTDIIWTLESQANMTRKEAEQYADDYMALAGLNGESGDADMLARMRQAGVKDANEAFYWLVGEGKSVSDAEKFAKYFTAGEEAGAATEHSREYDSLVRTFDNMRDNGRTYAEIKAEIQAEVRDKNLTEDEGNELLDRYYRQVDDVANTGEKHAGGEYKSRGYDKTLHNVMMAMGGKKPDEAHRQAALEALSDAYQNGSIHKYEISYIREKLGI